jgi:hypothetical protein
MQRRRGSAAAERDETRRTRLLDSAQQLLALFLGRRVLLIYVFFVLCSQIRLTRLRLTERVCATTTTTPPPRMCESTAQHSTDITAHHITSHHITSQQNHNALDFLGLAAAAGLGAAAAAAAAAGAAAAGAAASPERLANTSFLRGLLAAKQKKQHNTTQHSIVQQSTEQRAQTYDRFPLWALRRPVQARPGRGPAF